MSAGAWSQRGWLLGLLLLVGAAQAEPCVGLVPAGVQPFWKSLQAGAEQAAKELQVGLYIRGPDREDGVEAQRKVIDLIVQRGCRALVIAPVSTAIGAEAARLKGLGIPTLYIDRDMGGADVLAVVGTDNYHAGQLAGQYLRRLLGEQGRVALVRYAPGVVSTSAREQGFIDALHGSGVEVVSNHYLGADEQTLLANLAGPLDAVFAPSGRTTAIVYATLKRHDRLGTIKLLGFDRNATLTAALRRGEVAGLFLQQPYQMGYRAVTMAVQAMQGQLLVPATRLVELPVVLATPSNFDEPQVAALLQ